MRFQPGDTVRLKPLSMNAYQEFEVAEICGRIVWLAVHRGCAHVLFSALDTECVLIREAITEGAVRE